MKDKNLNALCRFGVGNELRIYDNDFGLNFIYDLDNKRKNGIWYFLIKE